MTTTTTSSTTTTRLDNTDLVNIRTALHLMADQQIAKDAEDATSWLELSSKVEALLMEYWR